MVIFWGKSSPSVAAYCYRRTAATFASSIADVMSAVNEDTCVDNIITGKDEESDAIDLVKGVNETLLTRSLPQAILTFHHPGGQHFW